MKREQFAMAGLAQALSRAKEEHPMYEDFYGFSEKPFSLTPDPKFFYRSESHGNAFDVLQYAIRRREGFVVITGDSGTGKTTLCRAILDQLDRRTFTALVLNPFVSEEDLLRLILQDFGIVSREDVRRGRLAGVTKQELINTLNDFLYSIRSIGGRAMLIVDEAQNLPLQLLEQIRLLSNLETDKDKLLQIVLVGQLSLKETLRSPGLRQLDQRVSVRLSAQAADARGDGRVRLPSVDDRRRRIAPQLHTEGASARASVHRRRPASHQSRVRSRAAFSLCVASHANRSRDR